LSVTDSIQLIEKFVDHVAASVFHLFISFVLSFSLHLFLVHGIVCFTMVATRPLSSAR